jgi:hypothetical protein
MLLDQGSLWIPISEVQAAGYLSEADELFYGGAAGGGKTDLILGLATTAHRRSIIYRREFPQLRGIIERGNEIIGPHGAYNATEHIWRMFNGRVLELGAVQRDGNVEKYQGRPHDFIAFDEVPHFTEFQYRFLNGWKRTTDLNQRTRTVATGNPPTTAEGMWVVEYWAPWLDDKYSNPAPPGELRWFVRQNNKDVEVDGPGPVKVQGEVVFPKSRTFIPAKVEDNPFYMSTGYKAQLQLLPEPLRSQMLRGDFHASAEDDPWQVIPTAWVWAAMQRWERMDEPKDVPLTHLGVDVARGGRDKTVLAGRRGAWFEALSKHPGQSTPNGPAVAALAIGKLAGRADKVQINVDVIGVGAAVFDSLAMFCPVTGVNFAEGSKATDRSGRLRFVNKRAELYWAFREALDPELGDGMALPMDKELLADLCAPKWMMKAGGVLVESKEEIVKRLGRSPDCADAVVLAYYNPPPRRRLRSI